MLRLQLIATDSVQEDPLNYQSGERGASLLNPTSTEPIKWEASTCWLIRWWIALSVQLRCFRITTSYCQGYTDKHRCILHTPRGYSPRETSDKQGRAAKAFTAGAALIAGSHLGLPNYPSSELRPDP